MVPIVLISGLDSIPETFPVFGKSVLVMAQSDHFKEISLKFSRFFFLIRYLHKLQLKFNF